MTEFEKWIKQQGIGPYQGLTGWGRIQLESYRIPGLAGATEYRSYRDEATSQFSFAILERATVNRLLPHGPFLEVGAGTGYWAWELAKAGADIIATDPHPYEGLNIEAAKQWVDMLPLTAEQAIDQFPGRTLLIVWPSYDEDWTGKALAHYTEKGGTKVVYVGEGRGGCTGDDLFHTILDEQWLEIEDLRILQWFGINDYLTIYTRK